MIWPMLMFAGEEDRARLLAELQQQDPMDWAPHLARALPDPEHEDFASIGAAYAVATKLPADVDRVAALPLLEAALVGDHEARTQALGQGQRPQVSPLWLSVGLVGVGTCLTGLIAQDRAGSVQGFRNWRTTSQVGAGVGMAGLLTATITL